MEKYTPSSEEIKKAEEMMTEEQKQASEEREWEIELKRMRKEDLNKAQRVLQAMEKAPEGAFLHINYQYKYRAYNTNEVLSKEEAIEFLKRYSNDPGDLGIYHGFNSIEILSEEEGIEEIKEAEMRAEREARGHEEAEEANRDRLHSLRIIPRAEIAFAIDPKLESENSMGISEAMLFIDSLKESVEKPADYAGDRSKAGGMDKIIHEGWSEHDVLKRAFQSAVKIESRIDRAMTSGGKKNYHVEAVFVDENNKKILTIRTTFDEDGKQSGGISMSSS